MYEVAGLMDASDLFAIHALDLPQLKETPHQTMPNARLAGARNIFEVLREGDVFLHHPYESFTTSVERFLQAAADDPDVLAIKLTLYRTGGDASVARLLEQAAERGKQVAVLIELQARFDEENNIIWATRLEDAGVHVSYGVAGLKTHAKVLLVVRREGDGIRRYVHLGTGNYNPKTARGYTDFGLLSADPELAADLTELFNLLTGFGSPARFRRLITAPKGMRDRFVAMIRREAEHARAGQEARIVAKLNAIQDGELIAELYAASQAGVTIDLIVRGICCLRPGLPGVSEHIRVQSIIGRFLEHSRAFYFRNGGEEEIYIASADWMPRNLDRRIEAATPIIDPQQRRQLRDLLFMLLEDNRQAWDLRPDGSYVQRVPAPGEEERASQRILVEAARRVGA
jgi:polyphosphate kinase